MTLEVSAKLSQHCVFFVGERVTCDLLFQNKPNILLSIPETPIIVTSASFSLQAELELETKFFKTELFEQICTKPVSGTVKKYAQKLLRIPLIKENKTTLLTNISLDPNQSYSVALSFILPRNLPNTINGKAFKSRFWIALSVQKHNSSPIILELNFRVFSLKVSSEFLFDPFRIIEFNSDLVQVTAAYGNTLFTTTPPDQFLMIKNEIDSGHPISLGEVKQRLRKENKMIRLPMYERKEHFCLVEDIEKQKFIFEINHSNCNFAKIQLPSKYFRLNQRIDGTIFFNFNSYRAIVMIVTLESMEMVDAKFATLTSSPEGIVNLTRVIHSKEEYCCLFDDFCNFSISVPNYLTPSFDEKIGSLVYKLRFTFRCINTPAEDACKLSSLFNFSPENISNDIEYIANAKRNIESKSFDCLIDIKVLPSDYEQCSLFKDEIIIDYPELV